MDASTQRRRLRLVVIIAAAYLVFGLTFGEFSNWATSDTMRLRWRRIAWLVSGIVVVAQIADGLFRLRDSPRTTALYASGAPPPRAGALAIAANIHEWIAAPRYRPRMAITLVAWPLLTAVP